MIDYEEILERYRVAVSAWTPMWEGRVRGGGSDADRAVLESWRDIPSLVAIIEDLERELKELKG